MRLQAARHWLRRIGRALARNLTVRLVILVMLALMGITGFNDYSRLSRERERLVTQAHEDERIFAETLALAVRQNVRRGRPTEEIQELLEDILARPGLIAVAIYNPAGQLIAERVAAGFPSPGADEQVREVLTLREAQAGILEAAGGRLLRYIQPFRWPGGRTAAIEVRQTVAEMEREFRRAVRESILSRLIVLVLFVVTVIGLTRWSVGRPIRRLIAGARAIGRGDLEQRIEIARRDEIGQLAEEFNRMAGNLQKANEELLRQAEERLRLEQEVQQSQKLAAVGMLAAEVAHEIGTPLNVISGRSEVLQGTFPVDHPERRNLDVILSQIDRINGIIRSLLDYTRPQRPALQPEDAAVLLRRAADLLADRCRRRGVRIRIDLPADLPRVLADADRLQQLFINLLLNALDASPAGETVRITDGPDPVLPSEGRNGIRRGEASTPHVVIHILDNGKGLAAEELDRVFDPFFSTKARGQGTGLGLPIVEQIVRAHRAAIEILSVPDTGTEVILRLPCADAAPSAQDSRPAGDEPEARHDA
jgi:signal transduction histidine kinase